MKNLKFFNNDELDNLYQNIGDDLLEDCLKCNSLLYSWRFISFPAENKLSRQNIEDFYYWINARFYPHVMLQSNINICALHQIVYKLDYIGCTSYYVVCEPDKLYQILSKTIKLKAFL